MVIKTLAFSLMALVSWAPASAALPTVRVSIEQSSDPLVMLTWGPPQAQLQRAPVVTGMYENVLSARSPYRVDTGLAAQSYFQACLTNDVPRLYIWRDTIVQPGFSLNGPLFPMEGGITTVHQLQPNSEDEVMLYNDATSAFVDYTFLFDTWFPEEPILRIGDVFFYQNNSGLPLIWSANFGIGQ